MDENLKQVEDLLAKLRAEMKEAVEEAYTRGWDDGVAKMPDYKDFHERHKTPQDYGEDGETVVISGKYGMDRAVNEIYKHLKDNFDYTKDEVFNQTHAEKIALATGDEEYDYYSGINRNGIFDAWVWRA